MKSFIIELCVSVCVCGEPMRAVSLCVSQTENICITWISNEVIFTGFSGLCLMCNLSF